MGSMHFEVRVERTPADVWSYLSDWRHERDWQPGWLEVTVVPIGALSVGTRKTKVRRTPLGIKSVTVEATRVDQAAREWDDLVIDGLAAGSIGRYRVLPDDGGARVALDVETRGRGLARLLGPLIDRSSGGVLRTGLVRLKQILESEAGSKGPGRGTRSPDDR